MLSSAEIQIIISRLDEIDSRLSGMDSRFEVILERIENIQRVFYDHKKENMSFEKWVKKVTSRNEKEYSRFKKENGLFDRKMKIAGKVMSR
ncbi:hypothetical protein IT417_02110 [bacterium]|nr:hypothetical protein [bacterium]